jgi:aminoglycoside phosphotransferase (APT) family kinase protein
MTVSSPVVADLVSQLNVTVVHVWRDGPRFWVGHVRRDGHDYVLKQVVAETEWYGLASGKRYIASDRLTNEIAIMDAIAASGVRLAGAVPHVVEASTEGDIWVLREFTGGEPMSVGKSNFLFSARFFEQDYWRMALDFVLSLQQATADIQPLFRSNFEREDYSALTARIQGARISEPSVWLAPYGLAANEWMANRGHLDDASRDVIIHGEMYAPHVFISQGRAVVIDWENAMLGGRYHDLAALWVRGARNPDWQDEFERELNRLGVIADHVDRENWATVAMAACVGNLNYLAESPHESDQVKIDLRRGLSRQIERLLRL